MAHCKKDEQQGVSKDPPNLTEDISADVNPTVRSQKTGKFRKTALTFFGVRKGICILPSFFSSRSKQQSKWSCKKGISKSKTHDGLSEVSHSEALSGASECQCQSGAGGDFQGSCRGECSHLTDQQKSLTLGRQRKGFKSLFQSFKQSRSQRNLGLEKSEVTAISSPQCWKEVPVVLDSRCATEVLGSEPDVPDLVGAACDALTALDCGDAVTILDNNAKKASAESELSEHQDVGQLEETFAGVSSENEEMARTAGESCAELQMALTSEMKSEAAVGSSDGLNSMFEDVASLKSFDSLTGCGDITADQEDDSITESTVSGERTRNGGKRTSCYLTYQGGGEEMASPEDLDERCLRDFWEGGEEMPYTCEPEQADLTEVTSSQNLGLLNSSSTQQAVSMDTSTTDALTPQSEPQESFPNSDEGYYDSITPGPEDGQDKADRLRGSRLPRDSYSGDALYELFAPDESLISPQYETKPISKQNEYLPESFDGTNSPSDMDRFRTGPGLYKESLSELPSTCGRSLGPGENASNRQEIQMNKNCFLYSKAPASIRMQDAELNVFYESGKMLLSNEEMTKPTNADCSVTFGSSSHPDFETFCEPKEEHLEENKPVALPYKNKSSLSEECTADLDDGQTVCFSQALVDYTKHTQMLGNLCDNVDNLEGDSDFSPNMEALPAIVTFDVVDMHNEGEYDEQMHMDIGEDISSPYQEFEDDYVKKDLFAACNHSLFHPYEHNVIGNTWAVASLPRHLGHTGVSQSVSHPLSLDRRSRSLDTKSPSVRSQSRSDVACCPQLQDSSSYSKKNTVASPSGAEDSPDVMSLSWQTRSEMAVSLSTTDEELTEKVHGRSSRCSFGSDLFDFKSECPCPDLSDDTGGHLPVNCADLNNRPCHMPFLSDPRVLQSTLVHAGVMEPDCSELSNRVFCDSSTHLKSYDQSDGARGESASHIRSPLTTASSTDRRSNDAGFPAACSKSLETTFN